MTFFVKFVFVLILGELLLSRSSEAGEPKCFVNIDDNRKTKREYSKLKFDFNCHMLAIDSEALFTTVGGVMSKGQESTGTCSKMCIKKGGARYEGNRMRLAISQGGICFCDTRENYNNRMSGKQV